VEGQIFYLYLVLAGACRFAVEFVRVNPRVLWIFSEAQIIALLMIAAGAATYTWSSMTAPSRAAARQAA
jgi:phosphatidylglycerol:prolipoprotein diacylglycerol transferase